MIWTEAEQPLVTGGHCIASNKNEKGFAVFEETNKEIFELKTQWRIKYIYVYVDSTMNFTP